MNLPTTIIFVLWVASGFWVLWEVRSKVADWRNVPRAHLPERFLLRRIRWFVTRKGPRRT